MAIGSILGTVAGGLASAGATALASNIFGSDSTPSLNRQVQQGASSLPIPQISSPQLNFQMPQIGTPTVAFPRIEAPNIDLSGAMSAFDQALAQARSIPTSRSNLHGLMVNINPNTGSLSIRRAPGVYRMMQDLRAEGDRTIQGLTGLLDEVNPGFGRLTEARVQAVENARQRSMGDLRDNIARRRISGSSFARDQVLRGEREFADAEAQVRAQSYLEELEASRVLLDQRMGVRQQVVDTELSQVNFETAVGAQLLGQVRDQFAQSRQTLAELQMAKAQMLGQGALAQADASLTASIEQGRQIGASARLQSELALRAALGAAELDLRGALGQLDADTATRIAQLNQAGANIRQGAVSGLDAARLGSELDAAQGATFGRVLEPAVTSIGEGVGDLFSGLFSQQQPATTATRTTAPSSLFSPQPFGSGFSGLIPIQ